MKTERDRAIQAARELHATGRYLKREACAAALRAVPVALSVDQLKALAFGAVLHGFGSTEDE
jgi:hypothetical protein